MKPARLNRFTGTMIALAIVAGGVGMLLFLDLYRSQQDSRRSYADAVRGLDLIGDLQYQTQEARRTLLYALSTTDSNLQVDYADQSRAADREVALRLEEYRELVAGKKDTAAAQKLSTDWTAYLVVRDALIATMLEGDPKAAVASDLRAGVPAFNTVRTDLEKTKQLFKSNAGQLLKEVDASFQHSLLRMGLILGMLAVLGGVSVKMAQGRTLLRALHASESRLREDFENARREERVTAELFAAVLRAATEYSIIGTTPEGVITVFNEGAERMLGHRAEEVIGRLTPAQFHDAGEVAARAATLGIAPGFEVFVAAARRGQAETREWTYVRKDGSRFPVSLTVTAMSDGKGAPPGFIGIATDITERLRAEEELKQLNAQLLDSSRQAGMAEVATGVLHNVGNVLNSVNISASLTVEKLRASKVGSLAKAAAMFAEHAHDLGDFLTKDPKGQRLTPYVQRLAGFLVEENAGMLSELSQLTRNIEHIKEIVSMQQSYARVTGVLDDILPERLIEDALQMNTATFARHGVEIVRSLQPAPPVRVDRHKVLQILINLLRNAKQAVEESQQPNPRIGVAMIRVNGHVQIQVTDNGAGIAPENMAKVFRHGFTTKKNGHGFGLHSGALAAKEMGGALSASSDGAGMGATFTLALPVATAAASS